MIGKKNLLMFSTDAVFKTISDPWLVKEFTDIEGPLSKEAKEHKEILGTVVTEGGSDIPAHL